MSGRLDGVDGYLESSFSRLRRQVGRTGQEGAGGREQRDRRPVNRQSLYAEAALVNRKQGITLISHFSETSAQRSRSAELAGVDSASSVLYRTVV